MTLHLIQVWLDRGFSVDCVLLKNRGELLPLLPKGVNVVDLSVERYRSAVFPLVKYLRRFRPEVMLASMWPLTVVSLLAARGSGTNVRVLVTDHSILSKSYEDRGWFHRAVLRLSISAIYRLAAERIAVSNGVASDLAALSWIPQERFRVIYNPAALGLDVMRAGGMPPELVHVGGRLILTVGTLKAVKDHALLVDAFSRLPHELNATLCILGEGALRAELEEMIHVRGLEGRVILPGFRPHAADWYRRADLFVLSSRHEGFGNVIVEALEFGVPVVSADCPSGPREILCGERYGRLVPVGDADAFAKAMEASLLEEPDRELLKARARDFSVDKVADEYLDVLLPDWRDGTVA